MSTGIGTAELQGRTALVTGGAQGIGFAIAELLGRRGAGVAVNDLRPDAAALAVQTLQGMQIDALDVVGNVAEAADVQRMFGEVLGRFGRLDILVNNAGVLFPTALEETSDSEWQLVIGTNLTGTFLCCRAAIPELRKAGGGRIVNLSSSAGKSVSTIGGPHYTAAKAGVLGLTRHLARQLASDNITVNAVCPGLINTEMVRSTISAERIDAYAKSFPVARLGEPSEIAELVGFLVSERAAYITGASLDINGGDLTI